MNMFDWHLGGLKKFLTINLENNISSASEVG